MDVVDANPIADRIREAVELAEDASNTTSVQGGVRDRIGRSRNVNNGRPERSPDARNLIREAALFQSDEGSTPSASRSAVYNNRKSPQSFYLAMSLVLALLAIIIAEEPFGPTTSTSNGVTLPTATIPMVHPWHDWLNFIRKIPKHNNTPTSEKKNDPSLSKSISSSSHFYRTKYLAYLRAYTIKVVDFLMRYIDPILLGKLPVSTPNAAITTPPIQEDCDANQGDNEQQRQQPYKEITYYSLSTIATGLMDKVITSTPRLVIFVNLILSVCVVTHASIASYYLGAAMAMSTGRRGGTAGRPVGLFPPSDFYSNNSFDPQTFGGGVRRRTSPNSHVASPIHALRLVGGFLLFKLLLISSVLSPLHTLDVLILLTWFTVLCFQRSLAYMAQMNLNRLMMQQIGVTHLHRRHQERHQESRNNIASGVLHLLLVVLGLTFFSGFGWIMFFYKAGIPMVLLLLMDSVILILDIARYLFMYIQGIILEGSYQARMNELEEIQLQHSWESMGEDVDQREGDVQIENLQREGQPILTPSSAEDEIERVEVNHSFYSSVVQTTIFTLELISSMVTAFHFLHIWYLHGLSFGLVDAILLLHLHSSVSSLFRKVAERHQMFRLSRSLNSIFQDATEIEMRKAHACGDLCCICLGSMLGVNVKKLKCGHLYHSHCLRKVVERARSITAARCPLCRSPIVGQHREGRASARVSESDSPGRGEHVDEEASDTNEAAAVADHRPQHVASENALFRFSTEGLLPQWLPLPAISFEIVRRQPNADARFDTSGDGSTMNGTDRAREVDPSAAQEFADPLNENQGSTSFLRRLLGIAFAPPMALTPEEEDAALAQLVEMFPQYERDDLRRELQSRNSIENVAESILLGVFSGLSRTED